jgi:hypothetical protein
MKRTAQEIRAWKAQMSKLAKKIKAMSEEEKQAFVGNHLIITAEGHRLSIRNTCLLLFQCPGFTPTQIGGFRQWQKIGRVVRQGESACGCIMVPTSRKKTDDETRDKSDLRFRFVSVFDVSQTDEVGSLVSQN